MQCSKSLCSLGVPVCALGRVRLCGPVLYFKEASTVELDPKEWDSLPVTNVQSLGKMLPLSCFDPGGCWNINGTIMYFRYKGSEL